MKQLIALEEVAQLAAAIAGLYYQPIAVMWWLWPFVFLSPDLSMVGYLVNPKVGAWLYNLAHHKAVAVACMAIGWFGHSPLCLFIGLLLYAHSSFDRALGYGLKYEDDFGHTHLGMIGKKKV